MGSYSELKFSYKEMFAIEQIETKSNEENTKSICSMKSYVYLTFNCEHSILYNRTVCHQLTVGSISGQNFAQLFQSTDCSFGGGKNFDFTNTYNKCGKCLFFSFNQFLLFPLIVLESKQTEKFSVWTSIWSLVCN